MDFTELMNQFSPRPDMDPFALGNTLATKPEAATNDLAKLGPPPPAGTSFFDHITNLIGGNRAPSAPPSGMDLAGDQPSPFAPTSPISNVPGVGPVPNTLPPISTPDVGRLASPYTGVETVPGVGPVPTTGTPTAPDLASGPTPPSAITTPPGAPPPTQGAKPDILAPLQSRPAEQPSPAAAAADLKKKQDALKAVGGLLAGVKAPPAPVPQKIASPSVPHPTAMPQGSPIAALLQQLTGGGAAANPLRLGNALYAGGRGIY